MALEWEKDGADGRAVRSPLKFKIGVPQLNFTTSVFFGCKKMHKYGVPFHILV